MNKIVKVIYQDGSMKELTNIKPLIIDDVKLKWNRIRDYEKQFESFEDNILCDLYLDNVRDYALTYCDLVSEDDIDEKTIDDFDDDELLFELRCRDLGRHTQSIC